MRLVSVSMDPKVSCEDTTVSSEERVNKVSDEDDQIQNAGSVFVETLNIGDADGGEKDIEGKEDVCEWLEDGNKEEEERISLGLIGKLWSERILNPNAFMSTIKNIWVTQHGVDINMIGKNLFQFQFYHWRDKERVLGGQPWHFDRVALLLAEMEEAVKPSDVQFYGLPIWARAYNVPFRGRYNESNVRILGDKIGDFIDFDKTESRGMEKSLGHGQV